MELKYDGVEGSEIESQYNGNIAGMDWFSKGESRQYGFSYDAGNRLKAADYSDKQFYPKKKYNTASPVSGVPNADCYMKLRRIQQVK